MARAVAAIFLVLFLLPVQASAQQRVALVIGNAAYQHTSPLRNPKNDAVDMAAALKKHGFRVLEGFDLDKPGMERKIRDFATALAATPDVALFFYAGHGLQISGQNYLVPIDAQLEAASAIDFELIRLELVHRTMEREARTNILFIDACRNNPLARNLARSMGTRSAEIGSGLALVEAGAGTLISFSTQPGNVALDGSGRNSPFATALIKHAASSKDDLGAILIEVRNDVMKVTKNKQVPWEHSALRGRFYFNVVVNTAPLTSEAERAWDRTKDIASVPALEAFIKRYGDTYYGDLAKVRVAELKDAAAAKKKADEEGRAKAEDKRTALLRQEEEAKRAQLFTEEHAKKARSVGEKYQLTLPPWFQIEVPESDVPASVRRFVGIWVDEGAADCKGRSNMLIVTRVNKDGRAAGYFMYGPSGPKSFEQGPSGFFPVIGTIADDTLTHTSPGGSHTYKYTAMDLSRLAFRYSNAKGQTASFVFTPVWTLVEAERAAKR